MYKIYLAGPISNISYENSISWRDRFVKDFYNYLSKIGKSNLNDYKFLSPMRGKEELKFSNVESLEGSAKFICTDKAVITRDYNDVLNSSCIVANLTNINVCSIGTVMEIAWAKILNKPVIAIMSDEDQKNNIYNHPMLNECIGFTVYSVQDAIFVLNTVCW